MWFTQKVVIITSLLVQQILFQHRSRSRMVNKLM